MSSVKVTGSSSGCISSAAHHALGRPFFGIHAAHAMVARDEQNASERSSDSVVGCQLVRGLLARRAKPIAFDWPLDGRKVAVRAAVVVVIANVAGAQRALVVAAATGCARVCFVAPALRRRDLVLFRLAIRTQVTEGGMRIRAYVECASVLRLESEELGNEMSVSAPPFL
jgi:hypothetical protein